MVAIPEVAAHLDALPRRALFAALMTGIDLLEFDDLLDRPPFHRDALCAEYPGTNFFPERGESAEPARGVCRKCPVRGECLSWAMERGPEIHGVWGGTSRIQRRPALVAGLTVDERFCCIGGGRVGRSGWEMSSPRRRPVSAVPRSAFKGFRFPPEVIVLAVRWYLRYGLSYRDLEELLAERGVDVDHVTVFRWVQCFTPLLADAARPCRHAVGDRWFVDETYVKVAGRWRYVYRAVDQYGQIIDVFVSPKRDTRSARRFFETALGVHGESVEVVTDRAPALRAVIEELIPAAFHNTERYANNRIEADHSRLKARLRPMRGLKRDHSARVIIRGHALMQDIRRGHYELGIDARTHRRVATAFAELARTI